MNDLPLVWVNGIPVRPSEAAISALDRGFTRADGVFETMRVYAGNIFELHRHLDRLRKSARAIGLEIPEIVPTLIAQAVTDASDRGLGELALRLTVTRGVSLAPGLLSPAERLTVAIALHELPPGPARTANKGAVLHIASCPRNERAFTAGAKTLAYAESIAAVLEATAAGADDAVFLDTRGFVSEGTTANVFFVRRGQLCTPALSCGVLEGITRAVVLQIARESGMPVLEGEFDVNELLTADEAFITSSLREILPVSRIGRNTFGSVAPGPVTARLIAGFADYVTRGRGYTD
jgi:branched-chain amino acid aminotransferase